MGLDVRFSSVRDPGDCHDGGGAVVVTPGAAPRLLTAREVAAILRVSVQWVRDHSNGKCSVVIPHVRLGRAVRYPESGVSEFIAMCSTASKGVSRC